MYETKSAYLMWDTWFKPSMIVPTLHPHSNPSLISFACFHRFRGPTSAAFLEWLTPSCLASLSPYSSTLSVLLNEKGGIIDDTVITKHSEDAFYVVTNAGRRDRDLSWFVQKIDEWNSDSKNSEKGKVEMEILEGWGLLALQGPEAAKYLQTLTSFDLRSLTFGRSAFVPLEGFNLHVARGGYTGEDGFEVFLSLLYLVCKSILTFVLRRSLCLQPKP
jgi:aminomethyltransferase